MYICLTQAKPLPVGKETVLTNKQYGDLFGPTVGDKVKLDYFRCHYFFSFSDWSTNTNKYMHIVVLKVQERTYKENNHMENIYAALRKQNFNICKQVNTAYM